MISFIVMIKPARFVRILLAGLFLASVLLGVGQAWAADGTGDEPEPGVRQEEIVVSYTRYEWWLLRWYDSALVCQVFVDHEGWPTNDDILVDCGGDIYRQWINTPACSDVEADSTDTASCEGLYIFYVSSAPAEKTILVDLPPPTVWVSLKGCDPTSTANLCPEIPTLLLTGEEPLPNEQIVAINVLIEGLPYMCVAQTCEVPLHATTMNGMTVEFWADSSFGDSSKHYTAQVRVIDSGVSPSPTGSGWYVDVLSTQWQGHEIASCAQVWQAFPPVGGPPAWLSTPETPELLATVLPYNYLAGRLIAQGLVDASGCPGGGLLENGYSDACGLEAATPLVEEWQNRFDIAIIDVANQTGVPAQLMKNIFAQESQFWPGMFRVPNEFGLGQLTDNGAEVVLLWNPTFFDQFCPLVLDESACERGYVYLDAESQAILRGALALEAKVDCPECPAGIDLAHADFSINLFAHTLLANCEQVAQIVYNATNRIPGEVVSYEDLWRLTVANYHSGPGCISYAMYTSWAAKATMDWEHISDYLTEPCQPAIDYVTNVTTMP